MHIALIEQLGQAFAGSIEKVMKRKIKQYQMLSEKDPFEMTDEKANWHNLNLTMLEEEIILLNECRNMSDQYREAWSTMKVCAEEGFALWAHNQYKKMEKEAIFWKETALNCMQYEQDMLEIFLHSLQKMKKAA